MGNCPIPVAEHSELRLEKFTSLKKVSNPSIEILRFVPTMLYYLQIYMHLEIQARKRERKNSKYADSEELWSAKKTVM